MKRKLQFHGQMSDTFLRQSLSFFAGGFQDAYTYCCRGSVFANAQTGNIVLLSAALFRGEWRSCQGALRLFPQSRQADLHAALTYLGVIAVFAVGAGIGSYLTVRVGVRAI